MTITVRYFAALREDFATDAEVLAIDDRACSASAILAALADRHPSHAALLRISRLAVDDAFVAHDAMIPAGSEVAVIPPVSGG